MGHLSFVNWAVVYSNVVVCSTGTGGFVNRLIIRNLPGLPGYREAVSAMESFTESRTAETCRGECADGFEQAFRCRELRVDGFRVEAMKISPVSIRMVSHLVPSTDQHARVLLKKAPATRAPRRRRDDEIGALPSRSAGVGEDHGHHPGKPPHSGCG